MAPEGCLEQVRVEAFSRRTSGLLQAKITSTGTLPVLAMSLLVELAWILKASRTLLPLRLVTDQAPIPVAPQPLTLSFHPIPPRQCTPVHWPSLPIRPTASAPPVQLPSFPAPSPTHLARGCFPPRKRARPETVHGASSGIPGLDKRQLHTAPIQSQSKATGPRCQVTLISRNPHPPRSWI